MVLRDVIERHNVTNPMVLRALESASATHPDAVALLITQDQSPPTQSLPGRLQWYSATQWLLG